ncbi:MAG TPA: DUF3567 family protein [Burkholderiales bacterium]|nr:DUF3567 family protein [Burkholderiales bacterium]
MNLVYNSDHFYVVEFAGDGYELVDKERGRGTFLQGPSAARFRESMQSVIAASPTIASMDEFLSGFEELLTQAIVLH